MIFDHIQHLQFLENYQILIINEKARNLVSEIRALVFNSVMNLRYNLTFLMPLFASFGLCGKFAPCSCQSLFRLSKKSRIINFGFVRKFGVDYQAGINSDGFIRRLKNFLLSFYGKTGKPFAARISANGESFNFPDNFSMKFDSDFADFGKPETIVSQRESALRIGKRIVSALRLKTRETRFTTFLLNFAEKGLKCKVYSFENVLRYLTMNVLIFGISFFNFFKLVGLVAIIQRKTIEFVGISPLLQSRIVKKSTQIKSIYEFGGLCLTRKNAEFIGLSYTEIIHLFSIQLENTLAGIEKYYRLSQCCFHYTPKPKQNTRVDTPYIHHPHRARLGSGIGLILIKLEKKCLLFSIFSAFTVTRLFNF